MQDIRNILNTAHHPQKDGSHALLAVVAVHLVTGDEALNGAHAEVSQLHVEETASLLNLRSDRVIYARTKIGQFQRLQFGHGLAPPSTDPRPLLPCSPAAVTEAASHS